jgi:hypothetical protein
MNARNTVETAYGTIDADALAELREGFATSDLLAAVDAIDIGEGRHRWLRSSILRLHAMASHLINDAPQTATGKEPIWQLAEEIADELDASTTSLSHITKIVDRLGRLRPNNDSRPDAPA